MTTVLVAGLDAVVRYRLANLGNKVINGVPSDGTERYATPPAEAICWLDVRMRVQVVGHRYLRVFEGRSDESDAYRRGGVWSEVFQEPCGDVTEVDEEREVAGGKRIDGGDVQVEGDDDVRRAGHGICGLAVRGEHVVAPQHVVTLAALVGDDAAKGAASARGKCHNECRRQAARYCSLLGLFPSTMTSPALNARDDVLRLFDTFRQDLDEHHDRRERLIKSSRDATNLSKKVIFLLHRLMTEDAPDSRKAARRGHEKLKEVQEIYKNMQGELESERFWRYQRQVSPGLQEYIEALAYAHYLEHEALISFEDVQRTISREDGSPYFPLTTSDYLLGVSDLTGELMRLAISGISRRGGRNKAAEICAFVRDCKADFERLSPYVRDLNKKQAVTAQSLQKIEDAAYTIAIRFSEYDVPPEMMEDIVSETVASFNTGSRDTRRTRGRHEDYDPEERDEYD